MKTISERAREIQERIQRETGDDRPFVLTWPGGQALAEALDEYQASVEERLAEMQKKENGKCGS